MPVAVKDGRIDRYHLAATGVRFGADAAGPPVTFARGRFVQRCHGGYGHQNVQFGEPDHTVELDDNRPWNVRFGAGI